MVSYAFSYEKDISDRPLRCRMDPFAIVSAHSESRGKAPHPLLARCSRRHLLRLKKWLPLAALPHDFPPWSTVYYHFRRFRFLVDTLGLPLSVYVTSAEVQDRVGAQRLLGGLKPFVPGLKKIWADGAYSGEKLVGWCKEQGGWELEIVERSSADTEGFAVLPHRWIVE